MRLFRKLFTLLLMTMLGSSFTFPVFAADDDGAKTFVESCSPCHKANVRPLDNIHQTRDQWKETIERMIDQGAEVPKGRKQELLDYLVNTHGPTGTTTDAGKK